MMIQEEKMTFGKKHNQKSKEHDINENRDCSSRNIIQNWARDSSGISNIKSTEHQSKSSKFYDDAGYDNAFLEESQLINLKHSDKISYLNNPTFVDNLIDENEILKNKVRLLESSLKLKEKEMQTKQGNFFQ